MAPILLQPRQSNTDTILLPASYGSLNSGPAPGTVAGIVLGSVGGFLLLLWLFYTCFNLGPGPARSSSRDNYVEEVVVKGRRKKGRSSSRRVSETVEVRTHERGPEPVPIRIVRQAPLPTERIVVEERRQSRREMGGDDEVVVIEDHSPPRRSKSKRDKRDSRH